MGRDNQDANIIIRRIIVAADCIVQKRYKFYTDGSVTDVPAIMQKLPNEVKNWRP